MTKIDVVSGFLGAGKTTLIKKLLADALNGSKTVLIENEFGEIGIDGGFLQESGIEIKEMNSGCICCSLVGDFGTSLKEVISTYAPERILIEPSGVGKLSDVLKAIENTAGALDVEINSAVAVVDASKAKMYIKNFGEFFINQIAYAGTIILSRTDKASAEKINEAVALIREHNTQATIITTPIAELDGKDILATIEGADKIDDLLAEMMEKAKAEPEHEHHHHHHEYDENGVCSCGHHHDDDDDVDDDEHEHHHHHHEHDDDDDHECCHHHHHDHDDDDDDEHEHHHHHHDHDDDDDDHECCCHHHDHDHDHEHHHHHHGHHADEVFGSWGFQTAARDTNEEIEAGLAKLSDAVSYGVVLRAKGMVQSADQGWIYFDYVPGESNVREGAAQPTGKICVIGSKLNEEELEELFKK
jgi:G3E family GTPase